ncbi:hypothetical protein [Candidatus Protochlamydia phocaeensis]|uniref:hypothetical protein n=1 Tax=Candidatus Protochlamydia phocaeensis TaxID=1414722 RepID=UPI000A6BDD8F|nr:hypothetical protein [Candidatus Protochlamydia phocaeensis]
MPLCEPSFRLVEFILMRYTAWNDSEVNVKIRFLTLCWHNIRQLRFFQYSSID